MATPERRKTHRRPLHTNGITTTNGQQSSFQTRDLSLGGSCIELPTGQAPSPGEQINIFLSDLGFGAQTVVRWVRENGNGAVRLGLQFKDLDFSSQAGNAFDA